MHLQLGRVSLLKEKNKKKKKNEKKTGGNAKAGLLIFSLTFPTSRRIYLQVRPVEATLLSNYVTRFEKGDNNALRREYSLVTRASVGFTWIYVRLDESTAILSKNTASTLLGDILKFYFDLLSNLFWKSSIIRYYSIRKLILIKILTDERELARVYVKNVCGRSKRWIFRDYCDALLSETPLFQQSLSRQNLFFFSAGIGPAVNLFSYVHVCDFFKGGNLNFKFATFGKMTRCRPRWDCYEYVGCRCARNLKILIAALSKRVPNF